MDTANLFHRFCIACARVVGASWTFVMALLVIVIWAVTGPMFEYSDTWQLLINTGTTIVTFLMVFLIQNAQNRDAEATQLKLDELIRAMKGARNDLLDVEDLSDDELSRLKAEFARMGEHPDDPVRKRLRTSLVRGRKNGSDEDADDDGEDKGGGQGQQDNTGKPGKVRQLPRRREVQMDEHVRPLAGFASTQQQWT